jgi:hypothetical protein
MAGLVAPRQALNTCGSPHFIMSLLQVPFRLIKHSLFGRGKRLRRIWFGAASGLQMEIDPDAKSQRLLGLDEREIQRAFIRCARWADVLVDVGSSDAYYGLIFRKYNRTGDLYLIDANPDFVPVQQQNFAANFPASQSPQSLVKFVAPAERQDAGSCLLSRDLPLRGRRVFFKIDVDGWELDVLRSAGDLLHDTECRFIMETHSAELETACAAFLTAKGYQVTIIPNAWWRTLVPEHRPIAHNRWLYACRS